LENVAGLVTESEEVAEVKRLEKARLSRECERVACLLEELERALQEKSSSVPYDVAAL